MYSHWLLYQFQISKVNERVEQYLVSIYIPKSSYLTQLCIDLISNEVSLVNGKEKWLLLFRLSILDFRLSQRRKEDKFNF